VVDRGPRVEWLRRCLVARAMRTVTMLSDVRANPAIIYAKVRFLNRFGWTVRPGSGDRSYRRYRTRLYLSSYFAAAPISNTSAHLARSQELLVKGNTTQVA